MWCRVYRATGPADAYLVRDWLVRNDIPAQVRNENLMSIRGEVPVGQAWPEVWVNRDDQVRAEEAIQTFQGPTLVHPDWRCAGCGELNPASFGSCWSCGRSA
jgi:hypothetical protein